MKTKLTLIPFDIGGEPQGHRLSVSFKQRDTKRVVDSRIIRDTDSPQAVAYALEDMARMIADIQTNPVRR